MKGSKTNVLEYLPVNAIVALTRIEPKMKTNQILYNQNTQNIFLADN